MGTYFRPFSELPDWTASQNTRPCYRRFRLFVTRTFQHVFRVNSALHGTNLLTLTTRNGALDVEKKRKTTQIEFTFNATVRQQFWINQSRKRGPHSYQTPFACSPFGTPQNVAPSADWLTVRCPTILVFEKIATVIKTSRISRLSSVATAFRTLRNARTV